MVLPLSTAGLDRGMRTPRNPHAALVAATFVVRLAIAVLRWFSRLFVPALLLIVWTSTRSIRTMFAA